MKIRKTLRGVADEVKVGSVEEFQGQVCTQARFWVRFTMRNIYQSSLSLGTACNYNFNGP